MSSRTLSAVAVLAVAATLNAAEPAAPLSAVAPMPVKELTVFKDGHAFVLHQGPMPTDPAGNVLLDHLPTPVLGTFWPYSADKAATLSAVTAGRRNVLVERTALTLRELVEANVGAECVVTEAGTPNPVSYTATVVGFPTRTSAELAATSPAGTAEPLPQKSELVLLKTAEGTKAVPFGRIQDVKFTGKYKTTLAQEEQRNLLTMKLDWAGGAAGKNAEVGMAYLQKGVRWIPGYRVELEDGKATVKLQATLINELVDLENVRVNLVVGVPAFQFAGMTDPIALNQTLANLSPHFDSGAATAFGLSNSIMTQQVAVNPDFRRPGAAPAAVDLGPDVGGSGKNEDLFVYAVKSVTLKKGQRLVLPVATLTLPYKDIYRLDLPFLPPPEFAAQVASAQQAELARLHASPKVQHLLRLMNSSDQPLTTAPALVVKGGKVVCQGMMTYTPRDSQVDLALTAAVDIKVRKAEKETKRTPNAARWQGDEYGRVDAAGTISLMSEKAGPVEVEVVRHVLGNVGDADAGGVATMVNVLENSDGFARPHWWGWYSWPGWWYHFNGVGKVTWKKTLEPGKQVDLSYTWHYYWR